VGASYYNLWCLTVRSLVDRYSLHTFDIVRGLSDLCDHDVAASAIVSNLARSAPLLGVSGQEIEENRVESWEKEIHATQASDSERVLDYSVWFGDHINTCHRPLSDYVPLAPFTNSRIHRQFRLWLQSVSGTVIYPQFQNSKSVSRATAADYHYRVHGVESGEHQTMVTTGDLERWYSQSGHQVHGPCEIRQTWGFNDLTPRTYFAQGGDAFQDSKYMKPVINTMADTFPEVNFISRFSLNDLALDDTITAFIYDYTSFTSLLAEQKYFLDAVADFSEDTEVVIVDSHNGLVTLSLGALIRRYNDTCNKKGDFTINRFSPGMAIPLRHERAGFLGVYGNITSCTVLHGLHACQLGGDESGCRCVGDDVFGVSKCGAPFPGREDIITAVESLGRINRSKFQFWEPEPVESFSLEDDKAWTYLKRPLTRFNNRMTLEQALFLPMFGRIAQFDDGVGREKESLQTRVRLLAVQTLSCIKQIQSIYPPLEFHQKDLIRNYLRVLYDAIGIHRRGHLPHEAYVVQNERVSGLFFPDLDHMDAFDVDPWELFRHRYERSLVHRIPKVVAAHEPMEDEILQGRERETTMTKMLAYLVSMDWATSEPLYVEALFDFDEYKSFYTKLFDGRYFHLYNVKLLVHNVVTRDLMSIRQAAHYM